jgi:uncharacterized DUF497 family protein
MEFEWDEAKRASNIVKHGLDFSAARFMWRKPVIDPAGVRIAGDELRLFGDRRRR